MELLVGKSKSILTWLLSVSALIFLIVVVGGLTRLTDSGLSMVDWQPIMGILPPITVDQWNQLFLDYKQYPEFQKLNSGMSLSEFKFIFFWEYIHRILGRIIGLALIIPFLYFSYKKYLTPYLKKRSVVMIILVILQGLMGWYMVKSGLVDRPDVSHFRLASHLILAFILLQYILWTVYMLIFTKKTKSHSGYKFIIGLVGLVILQIVYGAFVSGLDAGYGYNTYPKMGNMWLPDAAFMLDGFVANLLENRVMIQFIHRSLAVCLVLYTAFIFFKFRFKTILQKKAFLLFLSLLVIQFLLGVLTLIYVIPLPLALLHQFFGLLLFTSSIFLLFTYKHSI